MSQFAPIFRPRSQRSSKLEKISASSKQPKSSLGASPLHLAGEVVAELAGGGHDAGREEEGSRLSEPTVAGGEQGRGLKVGALDALESGSGGEHDGDRVLLRIKRKRGRVAPDSIVIDASEFELKMEGEGRGGKKRRELDAVADAMSALSFAKKGEEKPAVVKRQRLLFRLVQPGSFWTKSEELRQKRGAWKEKERGEGSNPSQSRQGEWAERSKRHRIDSSLAAFAERRAELMRRRREAASSVEGEKGAAQVEGIHIVDVQDAGEGAGAASHTSGVLNKKQRDGPALIRPFDGAFDHILNSRRETAEDKRKKEEEKKALMTYTTAAHTAMIMRERERERREIEERKASGIAPPERRGPSAGTRKWRQRAGAGKNPVEKVEGKQSTDATEETRMCEREGEKEEVCANVTEGQSTVEEEEVEEEGTEDEGEEGEEEYAYFELDRRLDEDESTTAIEVAVVPFDDSLVEEEEWKDEDSEESDIDYPEDEDSEVEDEDEDTMMEREWRSVKAMMDDMDAESDEEFKIGSGARGGRKGLLPSSTDGMRVEQIGDERYLLPGPDLIGRPASFWQDAPASVWGGGEHEDGESWESEGSGEEEEEEDEVVYGTGCNSCY